MGIIYCYTNKVNGKKYIGQTIDPEGRFKKHKSAMHNEKDVEYNAPIHRAMRKYGYDNFVYEVLAEGATTEELNGLEIYYIAHYNTQIPNGYNIESGGTNAPKPKSEETKIKLMQAHASLTEEEVKALRIAYQNHESPKAIYNAQYSDRLHYNAFMNIWSGSRYKSIMPEVFAEKNRHTKLNEDTVRLIKIDRKNGMTLQAIADKYKVSKSAIADICKGRTWKQVQI